MPAGFGFDLPRRAGRLAGSPKTNSSFMLLYRPWIAGPEEGGWAYHPRVSEIGDVLAAIEALSAKSERMALATIVAVRGSTYRRPGARLLVPEEGSPVGNISGGCLEGDVADMARVVMDEGRARLAGWDLTADDDAVWGLGLGCNGAIEVFI